MIDQTLARRVAQEQQAHGDVVVLACRRVTVAGLAEPADAADGAQARAGGGRVVAVLPSLRRTGLDRAMTAAGGAGAAAGVLVEDLPDASRAVPVARVITPQVVLDVTTEGLVIVELLEGVSAAEIQAQVSPTLKISPAVKELLGPDEDLPGGPQQALA